MAKSKSIGRLDAFNEAMAAGRPLLEKRYGAVAEHIAEERLALAVKTPFSP